jgi:hypothetical protein
LEGKRKWTRPRGLRKRSMRTNAMFEKMMRAAPVKVPTDTKYDLALRCGFKVRV